MKTSYIVVAGALWGTVGLLAEVLFSCGLNVNEIAFVRFFLSFVTVFMFVILKDKKLLKINLKDLWLFVLSGVANFLTTLCYYNCISCSGGALASVLLYASPIFVLLYLLIFKGKKVNAVSVLSVVTCVISCAFASSVFSVDFSLKGLVLGVLSAICNSVVTLSGKELAKKYDGVSVACYSFCFSMLTALPFSGGVNFIRLFSERQTGTASLFLALGGTVIPYSLYFKSLKKAEEEKAVVLSATEPLVSTLLESIALRILPSVNVVIGLIGVFISLLMTGIKDKKSLAKGQGVNIKV